MSRLLACALLAGAPLLAAPAQLAAQTAPAPAPAPTGIAVREQGLVGTWFPPSNGKRGPALLVIGGSEGGEEVSKAMGGLFAAQGYGVLALAYFNADGLPKQLQEIPIEYFRTGISWLAARPEVDAKRIGLWGASKGGEAALLIAAHDPRIHAVVAVVPSSVVWQGINYSNYMEQKSSFSLGGKPVAFVPYDSTAPFKSVLDLYQRSLKAVAANPDAVIPVEKIDGPVLLISGKADGLWPSSTMAGQVDQRLAEHHFRFAHRWFDYPDAGHGIAFPRMPANVEAAMGQLGGTPAGNAAARADAWQQTLGFFAAALGAPKP